MVSQTIKGVTYTGESYTDIDRARTGERPQFDVFTLDETGVAHLFVAAEDK